MLVYSSDSETKQVLRTETISSKILSHDIWYKRT